MIAIGVEIEEAIRNQQVPATAMSHSATQVAFELLDRQFAARVDPERELWERLKDSTSMRDENGWRAVSEFSGGQGCLLLPSPLRTAYGFEFVDGQDVGRVLAECSGFEFYVTNSTYEYLLCFNHHDYLIGCGTAKPWLADRAGRLRQPSSLDG